MRQVSIQIPQAALSDFAVLLSMPFDELQRLAACIIQSIPTPDVEDLSQTCAAATGLASEQAESVITVAMSLSRIQRDLRHQNITDLVLRSLENSDFAERVPDFQRALSERERILLDLLKPDTTLTVMSKARELLYEFQCILFDTAVLTDVRFVYDDDATDMRGGLILYTIGLDYVEAGQSRELHLTLDEPDINKLISQLERALKKGRVTSDALARDGVPNLTPQKNLQP